MLNIYRNITPNIDNNNHYYFKNFNNYLKLLEPNLLSYVDPNSYRFNNNIFRIALGEHIKADNYKEITYIVNTDTNVCYIVNNVIIQSGYIEISCDVDYWATYIAAARLENLETIRTNKNIGVGIYDDINFTNNIVHYNFDLSLNEQVEGHPVNLKPSEASIVFIVTYNADESNKRGAISTTDMFYVTLEDVYKAYFGTTEKNINPAEVATAFAGGITYLNIPDEDTSIDYAKKASVTKAYIVPNSFINERIDETITIGAASYNKYGNKKLRCKKVKHGVVKLDKKIKINPNCDYYIGTPYDGLKLVRTNETDIEINYKITTDVDGLQVIVLQGNNQKDITNNFAVALTYNEGDVTNLSAISNGISMLAGVFTSSLAIASGHAGLGAMGILGSIYNGLITPYTKEKQQLGHFVGSGDGLISITSRFPNNEKSTTALMNPLGYTLCYSIDDEEENAAIHGIKLSKVTTINELFNADFVNPVCKTTYIQALVNVEKVPAMAANEIKTKFAQGIFLINADLTI